DGASPPHGSPSAVSTRMPVKTAISATRKSVSSPAIARMQESGIRATGPLPADTVFVPGILSGYDAVLAMYHDQGLPVIKHAGFDRAVNITLGLPIVRTSVDHGTAL